VTTEPKPINRPQGTRFLWAAVLSTPALFATHVTLGYTLLPVLCRWKRVWVFHAITITFLALAAAALGIAAREWDRLAKRKTLPGDDVDELARAQFLAVAAVMTATLFFSVILAAGIPPFFIDPCQDHE
jgi:hypothetical protein